MDEIQVSPKEFLDGKSTFDVTVPVVRVLNPKVLIPLLLISILTAGCSTLLGFAHYDGIFLNTDGENVHEEWFHAHEAFILKPSVTLEELKEIDDVVQDGLIGPGGWNREKRRNHVYVEFHSSDGLKLIRIQHRLIIPLPNSDPVPWGPYGSCSRGCFNGTEPRVDISKIRMYSVHGDGISSVGIATANVLLFLPITGFLYPYQARFSNSLMTDPKNITLYFVPLFILIGIYYVLPWYDHNDFLIGAILIGFYMFGLFAFARRGCSVSMYFDMMAGFGWIVAAALANFVSLAGNIHAEILDPGARLMTVFLVRKVIYDASQPVRRRFGVKVSIYVPWMFAATAGAWTASAVSNINSIMGFIIFLAMDLFTFGLKCAGPSPLFQEIAFFKFYRKCMSNARPPPPQGSDEEPYNPRAYKFYDIVVECFGMSVALVNKLLVVACASSTVTRSSAVLGAFIKSPKQVVFVLIASFWSLFQDFLARKVSYAVQKTTFAGIFDDPRKRANLMAGWLLAVLMISSCYMVDVWQVTNFYLGLNHPPFAPFESYWFPQKSFSETLALLAFDFRTRQFFLCGLPAVFLAHFGRFICRSERPLGRDGVLQT